MNCRNCGFELFEGEVAPPDPSAKHELLVDPRRGTIKVEIVGEVQIDEDNCTFKRLACPGCPPQKVVCARLVLAAPAQRSDLREKCLFDPKMVAVGQQTKARRRRSTGREQRIEALQRDYQVLFDLAKETLQQLERVESVLQRVFQMVKLILQRWKKATATSL